MFAILGPLRVAAQSRFLYAVENLADGQVIVRGITTSIGILRGGLILAPDTTCCEWLYQADARLIGFKDFMPPSAGSSFTVLPIPMGQAITSDSAGDALSDSAESAPAPIRAKPNYL